MEKVEDDLSLKFGQKLADPLPPDAVVISGMSGTFPNAKNIEEFQYNLMNKVEMVSPNCRLGFDHPEIPPRNGTIPAELLTKYDVGYFGMHYRMSDISNPIIRTVSEKVVEAIFDAGMSPKDFENSRTGHFSAMCMNEKENIIHSIKQDGIFYMKGNYKSVFTSHIAHHLKLKGPSMVCDTACSSSHHAFDHAYRAIRQGECDAAIVTSTNTCLSPGSTIQFARLGVLSPTGVCSSFDENGNGYVRSEAVTAIILQKAKDAKRIYAQVIHSKTNSDGFKEQGITFPNSQLQHRLMDECCRESNTRSDEFSFMEAHGTGTSVGDPEELIALDTHIGMKRKKPILIGSVKSSIGHSESSAGVCSIIKVILSLENGIISPNINFSKPRKVPGLLEGRLKVVTEPTKLPDEQAIIGINSFGFGGSNGHVILKAVSKKKVNGGKPTDNLPRLVCVSGRTEIGVQSILDDVSKDPVDCEYVRLLQNAFRKDMASHSYKGYSIVSKEKEIKRSITKISSRKLPLRLVFGEINDWYSLAKDFSEVPIFDEPLQKIKNHLKKKGVSLDDTILNTDPQVREEFGGIGRTIVSICIGETLKQLEIKPESIIGNWLGNNMNAYFEERMNFDQLLDCTLKMEKIITTKQNVNKRDEGIAAQTDVICNGNKSSRQLNSNSIVINIGESQKKNIDIEDAHIFSFQTFTEFLSIIGRLFELGHTLPIEKLFPKVEFPVSRGTPKLSSKIKWNHERQWLMNLQCLTSNLKVFKYPISIKGKEWGFIVGHSIDGRVLYPAAGYLWLARNALLQKIDRNNDSHIPLSFRNCRFLRATQLTPDHDVIFIVTILESGYFEIVEGDALIVTGEIYIIEDVDNSPTLDSYRTINSGTLKSSDIYKELRLRGYDYNGEFRAIEEVNLEGTQALINWRDRWITFMDNIFQMIIIHSDTRLLYVPTSIEELNVYPTLHNKIIDSLTLKREEGDESIRLPAHYNIEANTIRCGGLEVRNLLATSINRRKNLASAVLETNEFIPNIANLSLSASVRVNSQIILENSLSIKVKAIEVIDEDVRPESKIVSSVLKDVLGDQPLIQADIRVLSQTPLETSSIPVENTDLSGQDHDHTLVIVSELIHNPKKMKEVLSVLKDDGYVITRESPEIKLDSLNESSVTIVTVHRNEEETFVLLRKNATKSKSVSFIRIDDDISRWIDEVKATLLSDKEVILFSDKNELNGLLGLVNCLRREPGGNRVRGVLIMDNSLEFIPEEEWCKQQLDKQMAINIYKDGQWGTYRHLELKTGTKYAHKHCYVNQLVRGDLSSLSWLEGALSHDFAAASTKTNFIKVHYAALNFRDVMVASGKISLDNMGSHRLDNECVLGFEFSGITSNGRRVMGMVSQGALATALLGDEDLLWQVPDEWSLAEASTVPVVYGTIIYALAMRGEMKKGDSVLIHSGTGGVGQAAIRYALYHGCTVFTTVGNNEKRIFLKKVFPQLKDENIGNSHDQSFVNMVRKQTGGKGVDIVLNSLAEDKLVASVKCLAPGGRFLEIGKFDILMNKPLCTLLLQNDVSFHGIMLDKLFGAEPAKKRYLSRLISEGIQNGSIKPLGMNVFKSDEVEQAFRFMTGGKHMGKVLIEIKEEQAASYLEKNGMIGIPRYYCQSDKSYVIAGGLGGFALELVDWLIMRGAKKIVLSSRTGVKTGYQKSRLRIWKSYGMDIRICTSDITTKQGCRELIEDATKLGPVAAVYNLAVVLQDALFENQTEEMFRISFGPKAVATSYLDQLTRTMCPHLRDFVIFSSVSCGRGNAGQTNYGMANSIMERICERRKKDGYPALAIQWGAIGEVGLVADMQEVHGELEIGGTLQQRLQSCMEALDEFLTQNVATIVSSMVVAEKKAGSSGEDVIAAIAAVIGINDIKTVSAHSTLPELGMDSMNAVEIKQIIERDMELFLTAKEIRMLTFAQLMKIKEERETKIIDSKDENDNVTQENHQIIIKTIPEEINRIELMLELESNLKHDEDGPTIFMIPGIEGFATSMIDLAKNLNAHVRILQYDHDNPIETIEELSNIYSKHISGYISKSSPFYIASHSYGVIVALNIIKILEREGYTGVLIAIDGSPLLLLEMVEQYSISTDLETNVILQIMMRNLPFKTVQDHLDEIARSGTMEEKIEIAAEVFQINSSYPKQMIEKILLGLVTRVKALKSFKPDQMNLRSKLILYRPTEDQTRNIPNDLGLSEYSEKDVEVRFIEGDHISVLQNIKLAAEINSLLNLDQN